MPLTTNLLPLFDRLPMIACGMPERTDQWMILEGKEVLVPRFEVRPHADDAWIALDKTHIGYEISFNKYFYQHTTFIRRSNRRDYSA